jgi:hypothetical protein
VQSLQANSPSNIWRHTPDVTNSLSESVVGASKSSNPSPKSSQIPPVLPLSHSTLRITPKSRMSSSMPKSSSTASVHSGNGALRSSSMLCNYGMPKGSTNENLRACAANGVHYVDITGEPWWINEIIHQYVQWIFSQLLLIEQSGMILKRRRTRRSSFPPQATIRFQGENGVLLFSTFTHQTMRSVTLPFICRPRPY